MNAQAQPGQPPGQPAVLPAAGQPPQPGGVRPRPRLAPGAQPGQTPQRGRFNRPQNQGQNPRPRPQGR
jgi:hypothetical protein